jgi:hypothetical protein
MQPQTSVISIQASVIEDFLAIIASYLVVCLDRDMDPDMSDEDIRDIVRFCDMYPGGWQVAIHVAFQRLGASSEGAKNEMIALYAQGRGAVA